MWGWIRVGKQHPPPVECESLCVVTGEFAQPIGQCGRYIKQTIKLIITEQSLTLHNGDCIPSMLVKSKEVTHGKEAKIKAFLFWMRNWESETSEWVTLRWTTSTLHNLIKIKLYGFDMKLKTTRYPSTTSMFMCPIKKGTAILRLWIVSQVSCLFCDCFIRNKG